MPPNNSYGSINDAAGVDNTGKSDASDSLESEPLVGQSGSKGSKGECCGDDRALACCMNRKRWMYTILVVTVVTICVVVFTGKKEDSEATQHGLNWGQSKKSLKLSSTTGVLSSESIVDPGSELGFITTTRHKDQSPGPVWGDKLLDSGKPIPTNSWYLNMLSRNAGTEHPSEANRVYTVPYIIDAAGSIPGIRIHWPTVKADVRNMQMVVNAANGLTLGSAVPPGSSKATTTKIGRKYTLADMDDDERLSMLGVSLTWKAQEEEDTEDGDDVGSNSTLMPSSSGSSLRRTVSNDDEDDLLTEDGSIDSMMTTHLVRGMPYATMEYYGPESFPSITSGGLLASPPLVDGKKKLKCGEMSLDGITMHPSVFSSDAPSMTVQREVLLHFESSDFTWIVFFSRPVEITCYELPEQAGMVGLLPDTMFQLFVKPVTADDSKPLVTRVALADECTTGRSNVAQHCYEKRRMKGSNGYLDLLRNSAHIYPKKPILGIDMSHEHKEKARVTFDWDVGTFDGNSTTTASAPTGDDLLARRALIANSSNVASSSVGNKTEIDTGKSDEVLMFALLHHQEMLESIDGVSKNKVLTDYCKPTFHGSTCLVRGNKWSLVEPLGGRQSFIADRPPEASVIPDLAKALNNDIKYKLAPNLMIGAADTYFPGKILARMGRVLVIAKELQNLADGVEPEVGSYADDLDEEWYANSVSAAQKVQLPSEKEFERALNELKSGIDVWINGQGQAQYLYDDSWGGLVNCGCKYTAKDASGHCSNSFPDCPALIDVNVDFGNGFYNDHHFHYGYNIYAAAVAAKFDPAWGRKMFDRIMLYVRDIANPVPDDPFFPQFRQKDWFLGSSWASGIISMDTPHGRNQESSSEAIAAYEGVTLFGSAMAEAFKDTSEDNRANDADKIRESGRLLTAMEVHATHRYWHVWNSKKHTNTYPAKYKQPVVGMLYETQASFQTWFDGGDMASIGIQLLPFTSVSERRDDPDWAAIVYPRYAESCESRQDFCVKNGWSVMLCGLKATIGDREGAVEDALDIPVSVFKSDGGDGHTRTNLLWYIATRPDRHVKIEGLGNATNVTVDASDNQS